MKRSCVCSNEELPNYKNLISETEALMDILLKNGKIYDGTGAAPFLGDILVRGDRIEKIGEGLICDGAQEIWSAISLRRNSTSPFCWAASCRSI